MHFSRLILTISFQMSPVRHMPYTGIHLHPSHLHTLQKPVWTHWPRCVCSPTGRWCQKWDPKVSSPERRWPLELSTVSAQSPLCSSLSSPPAVGLVSLFSDSRFCSFCLLSSPTLGSFQGKGLSFPVQDSIRKILFGGWRSRWARNSFYSLWNLVWDSSNCLGFPGELREMGSWSSKCFEGSLFHRLQPVLCLKTMDAPHMLIFNYVGWTN